jgi:3,4-dihydroxy 2-butanone 4-phosphate synthase
MLDSQTYTALSTDKAKKYARDNAIPYFDGAELVKFSKEH